MVPQDDRARSVRGSALSALGWATEPLTVERLDMQGAEAPPANSLVPAAAAAILDDKGQLLMVHRRDSGKWAMPGGTMEMDEGLASCVIREVMEETSVVISVEAIIGTYTDPGTRVSYSDGEVRREFSILFHCRPLRGTVAVDEESTDARWVELERALELPMAASQRRRIEDVISFVQSGAVVIR